jgi:CubicO group peptidase (beta-lactamase class C family)
MTFRPTGLDARIRMLVDDAVARRVCSAAGVAVTIDGSPAVRVVAGVLQRVGDDGSELPDEDRRPATADTLFDLASVTKVYSAHTFLGLVAAGVFALDEPIAGWMPEYEEGERRRVTLRHLLTHTSGLPATWSGWQEPFARILAATDPDAPPFRAMPVIDRDELVADLAATPLTALPGERWEYACTGFNTAMLVAERATGQAWGTLVARHTLEPLGLVTTTFRPDRSRTAASEYQPELHRGVTRGDVHDESSWSLGGVAANAGLFGDLEGVTHFAETLRAGGDERTATLMWNDQLPCTLGRPGTPHGGHEFGASLGLRIGESSWMGEHGSTSRGHTGFTGTSVQIDRDRATTIVILTNRVHPSRVGEEMQALRAAIADAVLGGTPCPREHPRRSSGVLSQKFA